jgi:hypothetical protein
LWHNLCNAIQLQALALKERKAERAADDDNDVASTKR